MNRYSFSLLVCVLLACAAAKAADPSVKDSTPTAPAAVAPAATEAPSKTAPAAEQAAPVAAPETPAKAAPATEPAAPAAAPETKATEAKPAEVKAKEEPAKAPEAAPAAPAAKVEEKPAEKPLEPTAAKLQPVLDSYQKAHDDFLAWLKSRSEKLAVVDQKIEGLKGQITDNEAKVTKLKMDSAKSSELRQLQDQTKALWSQLKSEQDRQAQMSRALGREAEAKVRELNGTVVDSASKASAQLR